MTGLPVLFNTLAFAATRPDGRMEPLPSRLDVVVVGAGVIGLSIGWRLARRGLSVAVVDAGSAGGGPRAAPPRPPRRGGTAAIDRGRPSGPPGVKTATSTRPRNARRRASVDGSGPRCGGIAKPSRVSRSITGTRGR